MGMMGTELHCSKPFKTMHLHIKQLNPLHPNINMHIPHTALHTFCKVRRICLTVISSILVTFVFDTGVILLR